MLHRPAVRDVLLLTILAGATTTIALGAKSLVMDEATSVLYARLPIDALLAVLTGHDPNMGLYYAMLSAWSRIFGETETAVRSLSALASVAAVIVTYMVGRELFNRRAGMIAGVLLGLNAFFVMLAQIARSYAILVLLTSLSSLFFVRAVQRPSRRDRIGYVIASVLAVHAHYFAALVLLAHAVALLAINRRRAISRDWLVTAAAILLLCAPETVIAATSSAARGIDWIEPVSFARVVPVLRELSGGHGFVLAALLGAGFYALAAARARGERFWPYAFTAAWLLLPIGVTFAVSFVKPMFMAHYLVICVPPLVLLGGAGIARVRWTMVRTLAVAVIVFVSVGQLRAYYSRAGIQDWRGSTRHVIHAAHADDGIVFFPDAGRVPFDYYARQGGRGAFADLHGSSYHPRRAWFVVRESDISRRPAQYRELNAMLARRYGLVDRREFGGVRIELYAR